MSTNTALRWLSTAMLAVSVAACGTAQGATPGRAGIPMEAPRSDVHLTEFDSNDTHTAPLQDGGNASGETSFGPSLVP